MIIMMEVRNRRKGSVAGGEREKKRRESLHLFLGLRPLTSASVRSVIRWGPLAPRFCGFAAHSIITTICYH